MKRRHFLLSALVPALAARERGATMARVAVAESLLPLRWPTQIAFLNGMVSLMDLKNNRLLFREDGGLWQVSPIKIHGGHSVSLLANGHYLINDTEKGRMLEAADLADATVQARSEMAGFKLQRPHDQVVDPHTGFAFAIDGNRRLYRFRDLDGAIDVWTFTESQLGYTRALSWFDGALHLVSSSRGEVLRIEDYERRKFLVYRSGGKRKEAPAGALASTGLVLNDVEKFDGWYYGSNYFTRSYAQGADPNPGRLIRWKTWDDFEAGRLEDLSPQLPEGLVPYFLSIDGRRLYLAAFNHEDPGQGDGVFAIA